MKRFLISPAAAPKKLWVTSGLFFCALILLAQLATPVAVWAAAPTPTCTSTGLSCAQKDVIKAGIYHFDVAVSCETGSSSGKIVTLTGSDNAEKIYNYLTGKGLKPFQAAGLMGNMSAESGFDPTAAEPGGHADSPPGPRGYGIVQWTPGTALIPIAQAANQPVNDLGFQLNVLWNQLYVPNSPPGDHTDAGNAVKAATDIVGATHAFEYYYERHQGWTPDPNNQAYYQQSRVDTANAVLQKYGSGASSGESTDGSASTTSSSGGCSSGTSSTINTTLPSGSKEELISQILATGNIKYGPQNLTPAIRRTTLAMLLRLSQKYTFYITQGAHLNGTAVDIQNINGNSVPLGASYPSDYAKEDADADNFITDVANLEPKGNTWLGIPNQHYKDLANNILKSKGGSADLDLPATTGATAAHFHVACPPDAE